MSAAEGSVFEAGASAERSGFSPSGIVGSSSGESFCGEGGSASIEEFEGCNERQHSESDADDDSLLSISMHTSEMISMHS
jgi:hypothetical protein